MMRKTRLVLTSISLLVSGTALALTPSIAANYGQVTVTANFLYQEVSLHAGGTIQAQIDVPGGACRGFVSDAPDLSLFAPALIGGSSITISVYALPPADTTLIVNDPNGNWICDDDGGDALNPLIVFDSAPAGRYDIWVGNYSSATLIDATLYISASRGVRYPILPERRVVR